jgi:hypothetical protein
MRKRDLRLFDRYCPDCQANYERLKAARKPQWACGCGLTVGEHKRIARARVQAENVARERMLQAKERDQLPLAMIKEVYDDSEWEVRRTAR